MRSDIIAGATFPDYELPDQDGTPRSLSTLQGNDPLVLLLARGGYCPKEHAQHKWMAEMQVEIEVGYSRVVTISTDSLLESKEWRQRLGARWPFLSDQQRVVQRDLDIAEYTDSVHDPMVPHTIFLEPGLIVHSVYDGYWYWGRPTPDELRHALRAITRKCRPDWNILTPEMRQQWETGERRKFFPYRVAPAAPESSHKAAPAWSRDRAREHGSQ
jgi:peroxiredoxin